MRKRSRQALLVTAALFSTGGVVIKTIHMPGLQIGSMRSGFAALALLLLAPETRRNWTLPVFGLSIMYALTLVTFSIANKLTTSADAIFLQDTSLLYILILSAVFLKERPKRADLILMVPLAIGISLFFVGSEAAVETAPNPRLGNLVAAFSGVCYATIVIGFRYFSRKGQESASAATVGLGNVLGCVLTLPFAWPLTAGHSVDWLLLAFLGVFQIGLAYFLMTRAMRWVPAFEASLLLLLEPVLNPIWTWLVYRERPGNLAMLGGALILGATAFRTWWGSRAPVVS